VVPFPAHLSSSQVNLGRDRELSRCSAAFKGNEGIIGKSAINQPANERGLPDRETQLALFFEQAPVAIAMFDTGMRFLAVSRRFLSEIGSLFSAAALAPADVIGRTQCEIFPGFPTRWRDIHVRVVAGEELSAEEDFVPAWDGRTRWVRWSMKPWRTGDGRIGGALLFAEIVTGEVEARHALADSEERFRATFENAAVGIAHMDSSFRWLRANQTYCRIVGWPIDDLVTKSVRDITHPDDLADELLNIEQIRQGKIHSYTMEKRYLRKDGSTVWGRLTMSCVRKCDGSVAYFVRVVQDISARKRAEEQLRRHADLLDQSHDAIFAWKIGDGITYWNRGAEALYGYSRDEAIGRVSHELLRTQAPIPMREVEAQIARQGGWYGELTHTTRDGREIIVESRHVRVYYDGELHALETNRDITARKRAEEQVHLLMREANHRAKNMLSLVQVIARRTAARDPADFVDRFTERLQALAANQDLLVRHKWKGVGLEDLVRSQLAPFADLVGPRITVGGEPLHLNAAAAQALGLALHELATNAGKYGALSSDAGHVDIGWRLDGDTLAMNWTERDGPPVTPPERQGFGTTVTRSMTARALDGDVELDFAPSGLTWRLTCPAATALEKT
jgi:PAS domain S-box-containing protein